MKRAYPLVFGTVVVATVLTLIGACGNGDQFLSGTSQGGVPTLCIPCNDVCCTALGDAICCTNTTCSSESPCTTSLPTELVDCTGVCCNQIDPTSCYGGVDSCDACDGQGDVESDGGGINAGSDDNSGGGGGGGGGGGDEGCCGGGGGIEDDGDAG
jgi:hypothetical protein